MPPRVERHALADQGQGLAGFPVSAVVELDHVRLVSAALPDRNEAVVPFLGQLTLVPDLDAQLGLARDLARGIYQIRRGGHAARFVDQIASEIDGLGNLRVAVQIEPVLFVVGFEDEQVQLDFFIKLLPLRLAFLYGVKAYVPSSAASTAFPTNGRASSVFRTIETRSRL